MTHLSSYRYIRNLKECIRKRGDGCPVDAMIPDVDALLAEYDYCFR